MAKYRAFALLVDNDGEQSLGLFNSEAAAWLDVMTTYENELRDWLDLDDDDDLFAMADDQLHDVQDALCDIGVDTSVQEFILNTDEFTPVDMD